MFIYHVIIYKCRTVGYISTVSDGDLPLAFITNVISKLETASTSVDSVMYYNDIFNKITTWNG